MIIKVCRDLHLLKGFRKFYIACLGEFQQIIPLLRLIDKEKYFVINTCMSPTIFNAMNKSELVDACCYHPFDFPWLAKEFFEVLNPKKYIITRHDIWPIHLYIAKKRKI